MTTLAFGSILESAGIEPGQAHVLRHAYVQERDDSGLPGLEATSSDADILKYTSHQSARSRTFPTNPPRFWVVFIREGGDRARLWSVLENRGVVSDDGAVRIFDLVATEHLSDLRNRLVIGWRSPRTWRINASTASGYPVLEIADAEPVPFPGFDRLILSYTELQGVMREHRYAAWRTALAAVRGVYLITDTRDGRHYVGKADGGESIRQRWNVYATNGHGGNVELRSLDPATFQFSLLRVFDPATPTREINAAENHFKDALDSRRHGLNRN
ncbi:GIY-YIG nuclease family protein [Gordonia sp. AC31]|uniref:GIY-YIG nuclease family protein n=1 Tax=Gordonia sp. AC31 TaxID=2962571 RepID=UPI00288190DF|nr:GIY-YIG nuclease family protein [Gordonia sp. AC31]MDT0223599.1 GIY-YIG nuclease family protein [Gordonia sp. AC31]